MLKKFLIHAAISLLFFFYVFSSHFFPPCLFRERMVLRRTQTGFPTHPFFFNHEISEAHRSPEKGDDLKIRKKKKIIIVEKKTEKVFCKEMNFSALYFIRCIFISKKKKYENQKPRIVNETINY